MTSEKQRVHDFWNAAACGEDLYLPSTDRAGYDAQSRARYELEPFILELAHFEDSLGKRLLEIGVGLGADHQRFAEAGAELYGIDLTLRAIEHTRRRLATAGLSSELATGDAETLAFPDNSFDVVYSWGVLHHSPDTAKAIAEVYRVLKPGGEARIMVYHKWSMVGLMLWVRYTMFRPWYWLSLSEVYAQYLESPGTKAYSSREARQLFTAFRDVHLTIRMSAGDLLQSDAGQRHRGALLSIGRRIWPRVLLKRFFPRLGLGLLIEARK